MAMRPVWYVATLKPGATRRAKDRPVDVQAEREESVVERSLRDAGFACYLPKMRKEIIDHRRPGRRIVRSFPLFTGYVFVAMPAPRWFALRECDGIASVLGVDGVPMPVPVGDVDRLRNAELGLLFDDTREGRLRRKEIGRNDRETAEMKFPPGTMVRVRKGPFAGFNGMVEGVTAQGLIKAAIEVFARAMPVEFPLDAVENL